MQGIELTGLEIAFFVVAAAAMFLTPPIVGALIGRSLYRKRTPPAQRTRSGAVRSAIVGAVLTSVGLLIYALLGALGRMLIGS